MVTLEYNGKPKGGGLDQRFFDWINGFNGSHMVLRGPLREAQDCYENICLIAYVEQTSIATPLFRL